MTMTLIPPGPVMVSAPASAGPHAGAGAGADAGAGAEFATLIDLNLNDQADGDTATPTSTEPAPELTEPADANQQISAQSLLFLPNAPIAPLKQHSGVVAVLGTTGAMVSQVAPVIGDAVVGEAVIGNAVIGNAVVGNAVVGEVAQPDGLSKPGAPSTTTVTATITSRLSTDSGSPVELALTSQELPTALPAANTGSPANTANTASANNVDNAPAPTTGPQAMVASPLLVPGNSNTPAGSVTQTAITSQVFPEVARLVTRGDGTQRITFRLTPDNLGEVRIVLTVRNGTVQVTLSGSAHAQEALSSGSYELHRLLESVGATSSQVKVSDLGTASMTSTTTTSGFTAQDGLDQPGSDGAGRQNQATDQHARMRDGNTSARDGETPGAAPLLGPTNPVTSTSHPGVDVTM